MNLTYGTVCSGIEAPSVAIDPLGWTPLWFSEIESFPSSVLAQHYPNVPNLGDMTYLPGIVALGGCEAPDVLIGGTPCQAFSLAGMRKGLHDARGQLTMTFVELADAIDDVRIEEGKPECVVWWENVPGVLSDKTNAFGCLLAALAGDDDALEPPKDRKGKFRKWPDAGCVFGPKRAIAWRVLDAQYAGLAQRRRRVFVVASARTDFHPAQVLLEFDGVRRDSAPRREAGQSPAGTLVARAGRDGGPSNASVNAGLLTTDVAHTLRGEGFDASEDGTGRGTPLVPVAFSCKDYGGDADEIAPTLRAMGHGASHANAGGQVAVAIRTAQTGSNGWGVNTDGVAYTLDSAQGQAVASLAFAQNSRDEVRLLGGDGEVVGALAAQPRMKQTTYVAPGAMLVRRLTPRECERLQGFPDDYTMIPVRGKPAADGPRYKALGNSMAVLVIRWIARRIELSLSLPWDVPDL